MFSKSFSKATKHSCLCWRAFNQDVNIHEKSPRIPQTVVESRIRNVGGPNWIQCSIYRVQKRIRKRWKTKARTPENTVQSKYQKIILLSTLLLLLLLLRHTNNKKRSRRSEIIYQQSSNFIEAANFLLEFLLPLLVSGAQQTKCVIQTLYVCVEGVTQLYFALPLRAPSSVQENVNRYYSEVKERTKNNNNNELKHLHHFLFLITSTVELYKRFRFVPFYAL